MVKWTEDGSQIRTMTFQVESVSSSSTAAQHSDRHWNRVVFDAKRCLVAARTRWSVGVAHGGCASRKEESDRRCHEL